MNSAAGHGQAFDSPGTYRILVLGDVPPSWSDRFEGMSIRVIDSRDGAPVTALVGAVPDQPALEGILVTLFGLRLQLISVQRLAGAASKAL